MAWVGGKKALREEVLARFPLYYERYIEVFGGGGWVLFHKPPGTDFEVYNDLNGNLAALYRAVRDHPRELQERLRYADAGSLLASLKSGAERLRDWAPPEQEQLDLFTEEDRLEQEYADVYKDPLLREYLAAEVAVCRIIQQVNKELIGCLDFEAILYEE